MRRCARKKATGTKTWQEKLRNCALKRPERNHKLQDILSRGRLWHMKSLKYIFNSQAGQCNDSSQRSATFGKSFKLCRSRSTVQKTLSVSKKEECWKKYRMTYIHCTKTGLNCKRNIMYIERLIIGENSMSFFAIVPGRPDGFHWLATVFAQF